MLRGVSEREVVQAWGVGEKGKRGTALSEQGKSTIAESYCCSPHPADPFSPSLCCLSPHRTAPHSCRFSSLLIW